LFAKVRFDQDQNVPYQARLAAGPDGAVARQCIGREAAHDQRHCTCAANCILGPGSLVGASGQAL